MKVGGTYFQFGVCACFTIIRFKINICKLVGKVVPDCPGQVDFFLLVFGQVKKKSTLPIGQVDFFALLTV